MADWLESTAHRRLSAFALLALAAGIVALLLTLERSAAPPTPPRTGPSDGATPTRHTPVLNPAQLQQFYSLERERRQLDESVWAVEMEAERHEDVLIAWWDALRRESDPFSLLSRIPFQELRVGTPRPFGETSVRGVEISRLGEPVEVWNTNRWREWLASRRDAGLVVEAVELRQPQFNPGPPAQSDFLLTANVRHKDRPERWSLRGTFRVEWRHAVSPEPLPGSIEATDFELLHFAGYPAFKQVLNLPFEPLPGTIFIDPLMVHDLNADGLPEIILGCRNAVFWNRGGGAFLPANLHHPLDSPLNTATVGDFDGDGRIDLLGARQTGLLLWSASANGSFTNVTPIQAWEPPSPLLNAFVITSGDVDRDGDLDLWLAQYKLPYEAGQMPTPYYDANDGFPGYLLKNDGRGRFSDQTELSGLAAKRHRRTYSSSFIDLDDDRDLDLVVVSDFAGLDLHLNDGHGHFTDVTREWVPDPHAFGMAHAFGDFDRDGRLDLFAVGMNSYVAQRLDRLNAGPRESLDIRAMRARMAYGNRLLLGRERGFVQTALSDQVARSGWSWGAAGLDFDNDGDLDLHVVNGHLSRGTARDYDRRFWRHDIYLADSSHDPVRNAYFGTTVAAWRGQGASYGGFEINRFWVNDRGTAFRELGHPLGLALQDDCRNLVAADLDADGRTDLVLTTYRDWPERQERVLVFRNLAEAGHWCGLHLETGTRTSPNGARVTLATPDGRQDRWLVTGDSYRSQSPATAHFGLGASTNILAIEVRWPGGRTSRLDRPAPGRYHTLHPPD